jgi:hypothetical protein
MSPKLGNASAFCYAAQTPWPSISARSDWFRPVDRRGFTCEGGTISHAGDVNAAHRILDGHGARYRLIDHPPEGRTEVVSPLRGNLLKQAAKCIVLMVKIGKEVTR